MAAPWGSIPYAPTSFWDPRDPQLIEMMLHNSDQQAEARRRSGAIIAGTLGQLGQGIGDAILGAPQRRREAALAAEAEQRVADAKEAAAGRQAMSGAMSGGDATANPLAGGPPTQQIASDANPTGQPPQITPESITKYLQTYQGGRFASRIPDAVDSFAKYKQGLDTLAEHDAKVRDQWNETIGQGADLVVEANKINPQLTPSMLTHVMGGLMTAAQGNPAHVQQVQQFMDQFEKDPSSIVPQAQSLRLLSPTIRAKDEAVAAKANELRSGKPGESLYKAGTGQVVATLPEDANAEALKAAQLKNINDEMRHRGVEERISAFNATGGMGGIPGVGGAPAAAAQVPPAGQAAATGEEFLKTLPPQIAEQVKAYAEGRMPIPAGFALKSPYFQSLMRNVAQYDPTFDAGNYPARAAARKDFVGGGKSAQTINALNTVVGHLGDLEQKTNALGGGNLQAINMAKNWLKTATGSPDVTNFNTVKKGVTDELTRVWRQAGGSEQDIKTWAEGLNASQSPAQLTGAMGTIAGMLESKLGALENQKQQALGAGGQGINVVTPQSRQVLDRLQSRSGELSLTLPSGSVATFKSRTDLEAYKKKFGLD